jgi:hypothetical protein
MIHVSRSIERGVVGWQKKGVVISKQRTFLTATTFYGKAILGESEGTELGVSDGNVLGVSDGSVLGVSDGNVLGVSDDNVLSASDDNVLGVSDGNVLGVSDDNVLGVSEGISEPESPTSSVSSSSTKKPSSWIVLRTRNER